MVKGGDKNSNFFHGMISQRRRTNNIGGVWHNSIWIFEPSQLKVIFARHFEEIFAESNSIS